MFNTKRTDLLKKKSESAIKIFNNTINSLSEANKEIRMEKAKVMERKAKLEAEEKEFEEMEKKNENFMNKINKLFED